MLVLYFRVSLKIKDFGKVVTPKYPLGCDAACIEYLIYYIPNLFMF